MISGHPASVPRWFFQATNVRTMLYLAAGVVLLAVTYRRLADLNEKRRVRVLMSGTAASLLATIPVVWYFAFSGYELSPLYTLIISLFFPFTLACPLAFAYAILRHRVFDIQVIIRQGLRYALARGAVLGVVRGTLTGVHILPTRRSELCPLGRWTVPLLRLDSLRNPGIETGQEKVGIETQEPDATGILNHGKANGISIGDSVACQPGKPGDGGVMMRF
jgi:hypothetical protein